MSRTPAPPPYGTVVFDCDSTLSAIEGIEELAARAGRREEIRRVTDRVMNGELDFEGVYRERLAATRPSRADLEAIGRLYVERLVPGARELASALRALGKRVCVVSGGLATAVRALADALGLDARDVFAVDTRHAADGAYAGYDEASPLARNGGKELVVGRLLADARAKPPIAMVGDGITDLEAAPHCARFVAYAGVLRRERVVAEADVCAPHLDFAGLLPLLCSADELERLAGSNAHAGLVARARALEP